jgi:polar amino acid transport system substrate-binding protein
MVAALILAWGSAARAAGEGGGRIDLIRQRGELIVGVKTDYPPFGMIDSKGRIVGFEPDLARRLADRLGVSLRLVPVTTSNRLRKLEEGAVDLVIATMGDTVSRRRLAGLLVPHYYASGVNIVLPRAANITDWSQLRGRTICLTKGAYFNRTLVNRYTIDPRVFEGTRDTKLALRQGQCSGWAYDDTRLKPLLNKAKWRDFKMPLKSILRVPWAVAVPEAARDGPWGRFVSDRIVAWHREGVLEALERHWGLKPSAYVEEQHSLWSGKADDGRYLCRRGADGTFPVDCLDASLEAASGRERDVYGTGLTYVLHQAGISFPPLYDEGSAGLLLSGAAMTLALGGIAILGSLVFGVAAASVLTSVPLWLGRGLGMGNAIFYLVPPILSLYLVFFGLGGWFAEDFGITLDAFAVAAVIFSLYAGASNATMIAAALAHMREMTPGASFRVRLVRGIERASNGLIANSVNTMKAVGLASTIAVPEVIFASGRIIAEHGAAMEMMNVLVVFYLAVVGLLVVALNGLQKWMIRWTSMKS